jgi:hypothetical protein
MNLQRQRHEYASDIAFCSSLGTNNGITLWEMQSAQNFRFLQHYYLLQTNLFGFSASSFICKSLFLRINKAEKSTQEHQMCCR